ncbi:hypothetical protein DFP72DRAFT_1071182 [Ephemerocybe angulata]|uniref:Uncharacterized protein n=1 Tax=Ephemerocybe angulata TaxID=980116 RepID=A0A8H6HTH7_9AGAR|nr:hypothetical protein DFP72DRAFT_1071182 [Tulosesus angulatus]
MVGWLPSSPALRRERLPDFVKRLEENEIWAKKLEDGTVFVLHYDYRSGDLRPYFWATLKGRRLGADRLDSHRYTHYFLGPCCFCAWIEGSDYTESKIGLVQEILPAGRPECIGHYAAICAKQKCGFFVNLEPYFAHPSLMEKEHYRRVPLTVATKDPFLFFTDDTEETIQRTGLRQVQVLRENDNNCLRGTNGYLKRMDPEYYYAFKEDLEKLTSEGLKAEKFWDLFVQCTRCNLVLLRQNFPYSHTCFARVPAKHVEMITGKSQIPDEEPSSSSSSSSDSDCDQESGSFQRPDTPEAAPSSDTCYNIFPLP